MNIDLILKIVNLGFKVVGDVSETIKQYQLFHGLMANGQFDTPTTRHIETSHRFCGHPDVMKEQLGEQICKWPVKDVTWTIVAGLPNVPNDQLKAAYTLAYSYWQEVCGLNPIFVDDPTKAMIQMGSRAIDGAAGVLAESELPCGNVSLCHQWFDIGEHWVISDNPSQAQIDLVRVACHELGHALGLNHGPTGNLMAPVYSTSIRKPQAWDIQQMQMRYGPSMVASKPVDPSGALLIKIAGQVIEIPGYRVTKLN